MKKSQWIFVAFILAFLPRLILSLLLYPYSIYDEFGSIVSAAYLAGRNWTEVLAKSSAYYGFGYYFLYTPVFLITDNPYYIYKAIVCGNTILQASCVVVIFEIIELIFHKIEYKEKCFFSVMLSYLVVVPPVAMNEIPALFVVWISMLLCTLIIHEKGRKRNIYQIILPVILAWGLTVHTRLILLLIVIIVFSVLYKIIWKENFFSFFNYVFMVGMCLLSKYIVSLCQKSMWLSEDADTLKNASVDVGGFFSRFDFGNILTWKVFFKIFIGQIGTATIFSGGLFLISIFVIFYYCACKLKNKEIRNENRALLMLMGICVICIFATIAGQMITWGNQTLSEISKGKKEHEIYKVFTYIRYFAPYIGPVVLCAIGIIKNDIRILKKQMIYIVLAIAVIEYLWLYLVYPYVKNVNMAGEEFMFFANRRPGERVNYYFAFVWLNILLIFMIYSIYKCKFSIFINIVCIMLILNLGYKSYFSYRLYAIEKTKEVQYCYDLMKSLENNIDTNEIKIYAKGLDSLRLQFYLNRYPIHDMEKLDENDTNLIFYSGVLEEIRKEMKEKRNSWYYTELNENVYALVSLNIVTDSLLDTDLSLEELK